MGNHYDLNEEITERIALEGKEYKEAIASKQDFHIVYELDTIMNTLKKIEPHIIGSEAVDNLRLVRTIILRLFSKT